ncbi:hypothetical protein P7C70_g6438, partial [Phenoliferia sp. Uapishka_3]
MAIRKKQEPLSKPEVTGQNVIMLGYTTSFKGYRMWDPETNAIHKTRDVKSTEATFPFKLNTLGGGHLNSTLPSVRPTGGVGTQIDLPLTTPINRKPLLLGSPTLTTPGTPSVSSTTVELCEEDEEASADKHAYTPTA